MRRPPAHAARDRARRALGHNQGRSPSPDPPTRDPPARRRLRLRRAALNRRPRPPPGRRPGCRPQRPPKRPRLVRLRSSSTRVLRPWCFSVTSPCSASLSAKSRKLLTAVIALRERRVELQQRALEQPELRRHFAIGEHLERALDQRHRAVDRLRRAGGDARPLALAARRGARRSAGTTFS